MTSYNAVPHPGHVEEPQSPAIEAADDGAPLTGQQRLAALKARLKDARNKNHKEVVAEDRRNKMGPEALKKERQERAYARQKEAGGMPSEEEKMMNTTAEAAMVTLEKDEKKAKRRGEYGWDVFNNEAQYRHYKKQVRRSADVGRVNAEPEHDAMSEAVAADPDPLAYGEAPPVSKERVQALVDDMHEGALRRAAWSRRRTFDETRDITYINKRNEVYNKKIERAFDPYTAEIRQNLERGTAL